MRIEMCPTLGWPYQFSLLICIATLRTALHSALDHVQLTRIIANHEKPSLGVESQAGRTETSIGTLGVIRVLHDNGHAVRGNGWHSVRSEGDTGDQIPLWRSAVPVVCS
jgi:hypothetical protein